jgi:hypothetical protein
MRDKYRRAPAETVREPTIKVEVNGEPITEAVRSALNQASAADAATEALKAQIAALKRGEDMQRQQAEVAAKAAEWAESPPSHKELLDHWEQLHGMPRSERLFLEEHPALIDNRELTSRAALEAHQQGLERGTDAFNQATLAAFHRHLNEANRQVEQPTRPAAPVLAPQGRDLSAIVSAPVSREAGPSGDGYSRPGRITLTAEERHFAHSIGLSETEYAKQKQRLVAMQLSGETQR